MEQWKHCFEPHIWTRGRAYYNDGLVKNLRNMGSIYSAVVSGTENYDVAVEIRNGCLMNMDCSCPYAAEGNSCKHMAAVLMAIEEEDYEEQRALQISSAELVGRIPETELRSLLANILEENAVLYRRLLLRYGQPEQVCKPQISNLRAELELIPEEYENRYGEIDYESAYDFACDIAAFIENQVFALARSDSALASANMGWEAVALYCEQEVDDSDGDSSCVGDAIRELYEGLLNLCSGSEKQKLFAGTVLQYLDPDRHWLMEEMLRDLLLSGIWGEDLKKEQLQFLDDEIARLEASPEKSAWQLQHTILSRLGAMSEDNLSAQRSYMDAHLDIPEIRKCRAAQYLQNQDCENAIRLLLEGKEQAKKATHYGTECDFSKLLIDAYEQMEEKEAMLQELEYYLFHYRQDNLVMLLRMKASIAQNDWEKVRERYLSCKDTMQKGELMRHEEMWNELLEYVIRSNSIWETDRFEADLKGRFPKQMLSFYRKYLAGAAERASNRKAYYSLMPYLKKLCKYPNGMKAAAELAADWRIRYRRRLAMLDELQKAGF